MPPTVAVAGHIYGPLGISRAARCSFESFRAAGVQATVVDVWDNTEPDTVHAQTLKPFASREFAEFNLFHLNGDEIEIALEHLGGLSTGARNAVFPMWELPRYPAEWAAQLERFDEVWAASDYVARAISQVVERPVVRMPIASQIRLANMRSRRYFGVPEPPYAFLSMVDLRSHLARKNPLGVIDAFLRLVAERPWAQACLVIKIHGSSNAPDAAAAIRDRASEANGRIIVIDRQMDEDEVHALIYNCDAFVSLHRAEGYGLGLAEAMYLGKPVIATDYSGNTDFMKSDVSRLVSYKLVSVQEGEYPHWRDQVWAEPDLDDAARAMRLLYDDPSAGRLLGRRAGQHMQAHYSFRAIGLRYLDHLDKR